MSDPAQDTRSTLSGFLSYLFLPASLHSERLSWPVRILMTVLVLALFALSDVLVLGLSDWPHLYGAVGVPVQRWEEVVIYTPFAQAFSPENLFPVAPTYDKTLSAVSVFPWITFSLEGVVLKVCALGNVDAFLLIAHGVLPVLIFWLIYHLFKRYVSKTWAVLLAFFGVTYFSGFHYVEGLASLFASANGQGGSFLSPTLPEAARVPFPSISLVLFLIPLYLTLRHFRLTPGRLFFLSVVWALQVYVYFFNFVAGALFFVLWIIYARRMTDRRYHFGAIVGSIAVFLGVCILLGAPCYAAAASPLGRQMSDKLFAPAAGAVTTSDWGAMFGYGLPIALLAVSFFLFQGDYYELFGRCMPVFLALIVDLLIGSIHLVAGQRVNPELYFHRISNIVFRFFYFIPFLYFISLPAKHVSARRSRPWRVLHQTLPDLLRRYIHRYRVVYVVIGVCLLSAYIVLTDVHIFRRHEKAVPSAMREVMAQIDAVERSDVSAAGLVAYESIAANLLSPAITARATLLPSAFGNFIDEDAILDRIVLYAKLFGWDERRLTDFLRPTARFDALNSYENKDVVVTDGMMANGLGYWLLNHKKRLTAEELDELVRKARELHGSATLDELLRRNPVEAVLVRGSVPDALAGFRRQEAGRYTLIHLSEGDSRR